MEDEGFQGEAQSISHNYMNDERCGTLNTADDFSLNIGDPSSSEMSGTLDFQSTADDFSQNIGGLSGSETYGSLDFPSTSDDFSQSIGESSSYGRSGVLDGSSTVDHSIENECREPDTDNDGTIENKQLKCTYFIFLVREAEL